MVVTTEVPTKEPHEDNTKYNDANKSLKMVIGIPTTLRSQKGTSIRKQQKYY
jgi:hypothetical protein